MNDQQEVQQEEPKRFLRPRDGRVIAGVCGAFARYFNVDVVLVRIIWVMLVLLFGTGVLAYLVCWIVIPEE